MEKKFRCTQFREYLIASVFAITAQFRAIKWRKRKHDHCAQLHAIPRNRIPIGNPSPIEGVKKGFYQT